MRRTFCRLQAKSLPRFLRPQPQAQPRDLRAARVNVDAMNVMLDNEAWNVLQEIMLGVDTSRGAISSPTTG